MLRMIVWSIHGLIKKPKKFQETSWKRIIFDWSHWCFSQKLNMLYWVYWYCQRTKAKWVNTYSKVQFNLLKKTRLLPVDVRHLKKLLKLNLLMKKKLVESLLSQHMQLINERSRNDWSFQVTIESIPNEETRTQPLKFNQVESKVNNEWRFMDMYLWPLLEIIQSKEQQSTGLQLSIINLKSKSKSSKFHDFKLRFKTYQILPQHYLLTQSKKDLYSIEKFLKRWANHTLTKQNFLSIL